MDWPCPDDSKKLRKGNENNDTKGEESEEKKRIGIIEDYSLGYFSNMKVCE